MKREYEKPEVDVVELLTEAITFEGGAEGDGDLEFASDFFS